jgi:hypothetical protein
LGLNQPDDAVGWARSALTAEPLNESAWTVLVLSLEQAGRPVEGLRAYESCRRLLDSELGCAPGPLLREAQARMLRATADDSGEFGEVLAALLTLQERLAGFSAAGPRPSATPGPARDSCAEAGGIVRRYLHRALSAA